MIYQLAPCLLTLLLTQLSQMELMPLRVLQMELIAPPQESLRRDWAHQPRGKRYAQCLCRCVFINTKYHNYKTMIYVAYQQGAIETWSKPEKSRQSWSRDSIFLRDPFPYEALCTRGMHSCIISQSIHFQWGIQYNSAHLRGSPVCVSQTLIRVPFSDAEAIRLFSDISHIVVMMHKDHRVCTIAYHVMLSIGYLPSMFNANWAKSASWALISIALLMSYSSTRMDPRARPAKVDFGSRCEHFDRETFISQSPTRASQYGVWRIRTEGYETCVR